MKLLFSVAALVAITAGSAMAQQKSEGTVESGRVQPEHILTLAANEAVQKDLGVSGDVARKLQSLLRVDYREAEQKAYQDAGINSLDARLNKGGPAQRQKYREIAQKVNDEFIPKLKETLTAEQYQRFQQIHFQNRLNVNGPRTLLEPNVAPELKLTDFQTLQLETLNKDFSRSGPFQAVQGKGSFPLGTSGIQHGKAYRTQAIELLTAEQKEALNKLEGSEFDLSGLVFRSPPPPPRVGGAVVRQKSEATRESGTLRPDDFLNLAAMGAVQRDLGLNDEVASRLTRLYDEYRAALQKEYQDANLSAINNPNELTPEQQRRRVEIQRRLHGQFSPKAEEILSEDQRRRAQQISFQRRLISGAPAALLTADVASELKLSNEQRQSLSSLMREFMRGMPLGGISEAVEGVAKYRKEYIEKAIDVLTAEQKETLNKLKGKEFDLSKLVPPGARQGKDN